MEMTFDQYILNPMGRNNAVLNANTREMYRSLYAEKFNAVLMRENGNIVFKAYNDKKKNRYYIHLKIPSEVVKKFYYDTVIEFYADKSIEDAGTNLKKYNIRFFSNDPAFVFTYAHVFSSNDLFITELRSRMSKKALKEVAKEKNPANIVGYVKSIYFAYLYMEQKGLFDQIVFNSKSDKIDMNYLLSQIEDADNKIAERQEAGEKLEKPKRSRESTNTDRSSKTVKSTFGVKKTKIIGATGNKTKTTSVIKSTKTTKRK